MMECPVIEREENILFSQNLFWPPTFEVSQIETEK